MNTTSEKDGPVTEYQLADEHGSPLGVFARPSEAMQITREVDIWRLPKNGKPGEFDGWRAGYSLRDTRPHFTIRVVGEED